MRPAKRSLLVAAVAVVFCTCIAPASASSRPETAKSTARVVIVKPGSIVGADRATLTLDGQAKKRPPGKRSVDIAVAPGTYEFYALTSPKQLAILSVKPGESVSFVKRGDTDALRVMKEIASGKTAGKDKAAADGRDSDEDVARTATITLLRPQALFGSGKQPVTVDARSKSRKVPLVSFAAQVVAGTYDGYAKKASKPLVSLTVKAGGDLFVVSSTDAQGQRLLGDAFFDQKKHAGALAAYRRSLALDSTQQDLYPRYADLAVATGGKKEALAALKRLAAKGLADGRTYQLLGDMLLAGNQPGEAQAMYDKAIDVDGNNASVLAKLGTAKRKAGDLGGAAHAYMQAILLEPDSVGHYVALGAIYLAMKDSAKAMDTYRELLGRKAARSDLALVVGAYDFGHGRFEDAVAYLLKVKGKPATKMPYLRMLGESHYRMGEYMKALGPLREAVTKYPKAPEWPSAAETLIKTYLAMGDFAKAGVWIDKYVQLSKPQSSDVAYYRAFLKERVSVAAAQPLYEKNTQQFVSDYRNYLRLGLIQAANPATLEQAARTLKKAIALADTVSEAWLAFARVCRSLSRPDEELGALQVIVATEPQHPEANARIGELLMQKGQTQEALRTLEAVQSSGADDPQVLRALAQGYARSGNVAGAIDALVRVKRAVPDDLRTRELLIELQQRSGNAAAARAEMKELLDIRRDNSTLLTYARLSFAAGDWAEATDAIENIRATDPENLDALMLLGSVLRAQKKYGEAVEVYQEASMIDPSFSAALYERAETHLDNSQIMWAEAFYNRALRQSPRYGRAELGLAKIAKVRKDPVAYMTHVNAAYKMSPSDSLVRIEYEASRAAPGN